MDLETVQIVNEPVETSSEPMVTGKSENGTTDSKPESTTVMSESAATTEEEIEPRLTRQVFNNVYAASYCLKTVKIEYASPKFLENTCFVNWVEQADECAWRKIPSGQSLAILVYKTESEGEAAFLDLHNILGNAYPDISVTHPFLATVNHCSTTSMMSTYLTYKSSDERIVYQNQVILERVPNTVTLDKIQEIFPDAKTIMDFRDDPISQGILTFEAPDKARVTEWCGKTIQIDGHDVTVGRYSTRASKWSRKDSKKLKKAKQESKNEISKLNDVVRIEILKDMVEIREKAKQIFNRTDLTCREKKDQRVALQNKIKPLTDTILEDTDRRLREGEIKMPEPKELEMPNVKLMVEKRMEDVLIPEPDEAEILEDPVHVPYTEDEIATKKLERQSLLEQAQKQAAIRNQRATEALLAKTSGFRPSTTPRGRGVSGAGQKRGFTDRGRGRGTRGSFDRGGRARGGGGFDRARGGPRGRGGFDRGGRGVRGSFGRGARGVGHSFGAFEDEGPFGFGGPGGFSDDFYDEDFEPFSKRFSRGGFDGGYGSHRPGPADILEERLERLERLQMAALGGGGGRPQVYGNPRGSMF